jgi:hypothetical protein
VVQMLLIPPGFVELPPGFVAPSVRPGAELARSTVLGAAALAAVLLIAAFVVHHRRPPTAA